MKKYLILLSAAIAALLACGKTDPDPNPAPLPSSSIVYKLDAGFISEDGTTSNATSKAVKSGWEEGDVIFVFSNKISAPRYLKMTYSAGAWSYSEPNGSLGLANGNSGTFRAVYLPFGNSVSVSADGEDFVFSKAYGTLYWTATLNYTVSNGTVSGNFNMVVPDGYVQLWIQDGNAVDEAYKVATDALQPVQVVGVQKNGSVNLDTSLAAGGNLNGYAYGGGYLFSGKMATYRYGKNYYFAKTKVSDSSRADYFVKGKELNSHKSVKLPANGDSKWLKVSKTDTVTLTSCGSWYTCNYNQTKPENAGDSFTFSEASALEATHSVLPTQAQFNALVTNLTWTAMSIHGKQGVVVSSNTRFMFLPITEEASEAYYWGKEKDTNYGYHLYFKSDGTKLVNYSEKFYPHSVRFIYK